MTNGISGNRFLFRPVGAGIFGDSISQGVALGWDIERLRRYLLTGNLVVALATLFSQTVAHCRYGNTVGLRKAVLGSVTSPARNRSITR